MKHKVYGLLQSLFLHGTIETSQAKAKSIKGLVDKIINLAKSKKRVHLLQNYLIDKNLQNRLVKEIVPKLSTRTSGYTSLLRLGPRLGDRSMMVRMSLLMEVSKVSKGEKKLTRMRVSKK